MKKMDRGRFFSFEGTDCMGKTTQSLRLYKELEERGYDVVYVKEFSDSRDAGIGNYARMKVGTQRHLKLGEDAPMSETMFIMCDTMLKAENEILPALKENKVVVCDRYFDSIKAYRLPALVKRFPAQGEKYFNDLFDRMFETIPVMPDITFLLKQIPMMAIRSIERREGKLDEETRKFILETMKVYDSISSRKDVIKIDTSIGMESSAEEITRRALWELGGIEYDHTLPLAYRSKPKITALACD